MLIKCFSPMAFSLSDKTAQHNHILYRYSSVMKRYDFLRGIQQNPEQSTPRVSSFYYHLCSFVVAFKKGNLT
jgi:hypothetical protein